MRIILFDCDMNDKFSFSTLKIIKAGITVILVTEIVLPIKPGQNFSDCSYLEERQGREGKVERDSKNHDFCSFLSFFYF